MKNYLVTLTALLFAYVAIAQNKQCITPFVNSQLSDKYKLKQKENDLLISSYIQSGNATRAGSVPLIVPVVFHVIHQNGPENIPDSIITREIDSLNAYFSNSGPYYNPIGAAVNVQFCLASVDPYGNPTTGITRDTSVYADVVFGISSSNDEKMKNVNRWNPYRYMNIWLVKSVSGYSNAYATYPSALGYMNDGVVITSQSLGGIHYLITHESGHYLGLFHTTEGDSCVNFNCLLDGDRVCDTPPEYPGNYSCLVSSCNTEMDDTSGFNPFATDQLDGSTIMQPRQNCSMYFTQGQASRMETSLSLIRFDLLQSNACGANSGGVVPTASIVQLPSWCSFYSFANVGTGAEYEEWDFDNDGYFEAQGDTVSHLYYQSGYYTIVLRAFAKGGYDTDTLTVYIHAAPNSFYPMQSINGVQSGLTVCRGTLVTFTAVPGMASYIWSNGDTTQSTSFTPDSTVDLSLTCIDSTGYVWAQCPAYVYHLTIVEPPLKATIYGLSPDSICKFDTLLVAAHIQPGQTLVHWIINNFNNPSNDTLLTIYPYTNNFALSVIVTDSTGCKTYSDTVNFYVDPVPNQPWIPYTFNGQVFGQGGSWHDQFYLNGVAIPGATQSPYTVTQPGCYSVASYFSFPQCEVMSDTVCFQTVGISELMEQSNIYVYPNPSGDFIFIRTAIKKGDLQIFNSISRLVYESKNFQGEARIDISHLSQGVYWIKYDGKFIRFVKL